MQNRYPCVRFKQRVLMRATYERGNTLTNFKSFLNLPVQSGNLLKLYCPKALVSDLGPLA
jgi:hypothetical protein